MATFVATTASNAPLLKDVEGVTKVMEQYFWDDEVAPVIQTDRGQPCLAIHGYGWPASWRIPDGVSKDDFEPDYAVDSSDGFEQFLKAVALFLTEPLIVQSVGFFNCRFPVSACEWRIVPGGSEIEINGFKHSLDDREDTISASEFFI
jgi:hypothetical protein